LAEGPHHFTTVVSRLGWSHFYVNLDVSTKLREKNRWLNRINKTFIFGIFWNFPEKQNNCKTAKMIARMFFYKMVGFFGIFRKKTTEIRTALIFV
jgi:hypothetical protein